MTVGCLCVSRTRRRRRRQQMTTYDRRLLKRLQTTRYDSPTTAAADCQYRAFIYGGPSPSSCYCCAHCRDACCPASWVSAPGGGGGSPLLAPGPDLGAPVEDGGGVVPAGRTPALYCSCGLVRAASGLIQANDPDVDRKSDDGDVTPPRCRVLNGLSAT